MGSRAVEGFMEALPPGVVAVFDEAYREYVEDPDYPDTMRYLRQGRDVIILRTFSKVYALAGMRVGYALAPAGLIRCLNLVKQPFNVSSVAEAGALASLHDPGHLARSIASNADGKRGWG